MDEVITIQRVLKHKGVTCTPEDVSTIWSKITMLFHVVGGLGGTCMEVRVQGTLFTRHSASCRKVSEGISTSTA